MPGGRFNTGGDVKSGTDKETKDQGSSNLGDVLGTLGINILDMLNPGGIRTSGGRGGGWYTPRGQYGPLVTGAMMGGPTASGKFGWPVPRRDEGYRTWGDLLPTGGGGSARPLDEVALDELGLGGANVFDTTPYLIPDYIKNI